VLTVDLAKIPDEKCLLGIRFMTCGGAVRIHDTSPKMDIGVSLVERRKGREYDVSGGNGGIVEAMVSYWGVAEGCRLAPDILLGWVAICRTLKQEIDGVEGGKCFDLRHRVDGRAVWK
jgi:hypothetical protein